MAAAQQTHFEPARSALEDGDFIPLPGHIENRIAFAGTRVHFDEGIRNHDLRLVLAEPRCRSASVGVRTEQQPDQQQCVPESSHSAP